MQAIAGESVRRLLTAELRLPIEERVSAHLDRAWQVSQTEDKTDESSHPAAILGDETFAVFIITLELASVSTLGQSKKIIIVTIQVSIALHPTGSRSSG